MGTFSVKSPTFLNSADDRIPAGWDRYRLTARAGRRAVRKFGRPVWGRMAVSVAAIPDSRPFGPIGCHLANSFKGSVEFVSKMRFERFIFWWGIS